MDGMDSVRQKAIIKLSYISQKSGWETLPSLTFFLAAVIPYIGSNWIKENKKNPILKCDFFWHLTVERSCIQLFLLSKNLVVWKTVACIQCVTWDLFQQIRFSIIFTFEEYSSMEVGSNKIKSPAILCNRPKTRTHL